MSTTTVPDFLEEIVPDFLEGIASAACSPFTQLLRHSLPGFLGDNEPILKQVKKLIADSHFSQAYSDALLSVLLAISLEQREEFIRINPKVFESWTTELSVIGLPVLARVASSEWSALLLLMQGPTLPSQHDYYIHRQAWDVLSKKELNLLACWITRFRLATRNQSKPAPVWMENYCNWCQGDIAFMLRQAWDVSYIDIAKSIYLSNNYSAPSDTLRKRSKVFVEQRDSFLKQLNQEVIPAGCPGIIMAALTGQHHARYSHRILDLCVGIRLLHAEITQANNT